MSVIIRLQNLPLSASSIDIRTFFRGLSIPDGGVHIVGGKDGDAFIAFSTDEDARQAMALSGNNLKDLPVKLLLSSRNEMFKIIDQTRQRALGIAPSDGSPQSQSVPVPSQNSSISSTNAGLHSQTNPMGSPSTNNPMNTSAALDQQQQQHHSMPPISSNSVPNMGGMSGFPAGLGMNLPAGNMNAFSSMKLPPGITPQQLSAMMPGTNMASMFSAQQTGALGQQQTQQQQAPTNPFMMPNSMMNANQGQGGMPMGFPGMLSNLMNPNIPPTLANQMMNPNISASVPTSSISNGPNGNTLPGPFNFNSAVRGVPTNLPGSAFSFTSPPPGHQGFPGTAGLSQQNHTSMIHNPAFDNGHGPQTQGGQQRAAFNHLQQPNMLAPHISAMPSPTHQQQTQLEPQSARNHRPLNDGQRNGFQGGMGSRAGTGPPPSVGLNSDFAQVRDRERGGRDRDRDNREKDLLPERSRPDRNRKRTPERRESRDSRGERRRRTRSRDRDATSTTRTSREGRRPRSTKSRSRTRSRSRNRDRSERNSRPNSARDTVSKPSSSSVPAKIDSESRNSSGNEPDLIIVEHIVPQELQSCVKLTGVPKEATYREVKDFIRAEISAGGSSEGLVRNFDDGTAFVRLERSVDFDKVLRSNGRKLCGATIRVEGITVEKFENELKANKRPSEPDRGNRSRAERDRSDRTDRDRERDRAPRSEREPRETSRSRDLNDSRGSRDRDRSTKECCLVIRGLPPAFSGKDVAMNTLSGLKRFAYSDIHVHVEPVDMNGRTFATAFVKFVSEYEAEKAIEMFKMQALPVKAEIHEVEELYRIRDGGIKPRPRGRSSEGQSHFDGDIGLDIESNMVILKGVPPNMSDRDVFDFFSDIGLSPINVRMLSDPHGNRNGQVMCEFQDPSQARRATTKDGMLFGRSTVSVSFVPRKGSPGGALRGGHRGGMGNGPSGFAPNPRFRGPTPAQSANPFVQELIAQTGMINGPPVPHGGPRGRGGPRMRGGRGGGPPGHRPSRFSPADSSLDLGHGQIEPSPDHSFFERPDCVVAVTNIPFSASMDDILEFLSRNLSKPIQGDRIIRRYNEFKKPTGDARIAFASPFEAQQAVAELTGTVLWNRTLQVSILSDTL